MWEALVYRVAYLPGRQSQRSGDRLSAYVVFGWRRELMCSHRLAAVLDDLRSAVRLVLVNSSRAWSSSGGVVVIERQVEVLRTIAGLWRLRRAPNLLDRTRDRWDRWRCRGRSCRRSVQIVRFAIR